MENKLKPCPFCGSSSMRIAAGDSIAIIHCNICKAEMCRMIGEDFDTYEIKTAKEFAIEAWNRRCNDGE